MSIRSRLVLVIACFSIFPIPVLATNGYFLIGHGIKSRGMGGVGFALPQQSQAAAVNPAGLVDLGTRIDVDATLFLPRRRSACCVSPGGVVSGSNVFLIPSMGGAFKFNRKMSMGFAAVGAGANSRFADNFFFDDPSLPGPQADKTSGSLGIQLMQMIMAPGVAYKLNKNHAVGASLQFGLQTFRAYGLNDAFARFSQDPNNLTNRGNDWSYGAGIRLGWRGKFFDQKLTLGGSYASKVYMSKFKKYAGLFADKGGFDIPENFGVGIAINPIKKLTIAFDWQRILYSDVPSVGNPTLPISADPNNTVDKLGNRNGPGFEWDDQDVYKIGAAYDWSDSLTLRLGYNYGKTPIQENESLEFNVLAPATTESHYTIGATYRVGNAHEWNFAFQHARRNKLETVVDANAGLPFSGPIATELYVNTFEIGYSFILN